MKVLIADDQVLIREGLRQILLRMPEVETVDEAANGQDVMKKVNKKKYDIIILDISMPGRSGLEILKDLKQKKPNSVVLILSIHPEENYAVRVLKAGAAGYINKSSASDELVQAIRTVVAGGKYITPKTADKLVKEINIDSSKSSHDKLSDREYQVMCMIASGKTIKEISEYLCLSIKTVSTYRSRILEKMQMKNNSEIAFYAIKKELIS
jgi:DNA-binding NarL/FixJ family response regulator